MQALMRLLKNYWEYQMKVDSKNLSKELLQEHAGEIFDHNFSKISNCLSYIYHNKDNFLESKSIETGALKEYIKLFEDRMDKLFDAMEHKEAPIKISCERKDIWAFVRFLESKNLNVLLDIERNNAGVTIKALDKDNKLIFFISFLNIDNFNTYIEEIGFESIFNVGCANVRGSYCIDDNCVIPGED